MSDKIKQNRLVLIFLVLGLIFLITGVLLNNYISPKQVTVNIINKLSKNITDIIDNSTISTGLEENYKTTQNIKMTVQSDYIKNLATVDSNFQNINKLLDNLSNTNSNITIVQDKQNKKLFIDYNSKLQDIPLINTKYLVEDSTEYYYIDGFNSYVNNGNNNYFESLNSTTTNKENLKYIVEKISESFANNLKREYLKESYEENYKKIVIEPSENDLIELANNILNDLKNDKKANKIMTGYDKDFAKRKITSEQITKISNIKLIIYIDKLSLKVAKYELYFDKENKIIYYNKDNKKIYEIINNGKLVAKLESVFEKNKIKIDILDANNKLLGTTASSKTSTNHEIVSNIATNELNFSFLYNNQLTNLKKSKSFDSNINIKMNISKNNINLINLNISAVGKTTNDTTINEDVSNSVLASSIPQKDTIINQKLTTIINKLMS